MLEKLDVKVALANADIAHWELTVLDICRRRATPGGLSLLLRRLKCIGMRRFVDAAVSALVGDPATYRLYLERELARKSRG